MQFRIGDVVRFVHGEDHYTVVDLTKLDATDQFGRRNATTGKVGLVPEWGITKTYDRDTWIIGQFFVHPKHLELVYQSAARRGEDRLGGYEVATAGQVHH